MGLFIFSCVVKEKEKIYFFLFASLTTLSNSKHCSRSCIVIHVQYRLWSIFSSVYPSLDAGKIRVIMRRLPLWYFILEADSCKRFHGQNRSFSASEEGNGIFTISKCFQMIKQILCLDFLHKIQLQIVKNHQALNQKVPFTLSIFKKCFLVTPSLYRDRSARCFLILHCI